MSYEEVYNDNNSKFVSVAFDGDDVYLNTQMYFKNSWIKGKKSGNTITFPTGQFLGYDGQDFYYAIAIKYEMDYYSWSDTQKYINYYYAPEFSLTYNPDTKVLMYADQNVGFGITNGDGMIDVADITAIASTILKPTPEQLYVDLGLPSGIKWAKCNLGANSPEEPGGYYSWGETKTKDEYSWATYPDATDGRGYAFAKYYIEGGKTVLDPEDDAVRVIMGGDWRMPTLAEITELMDNCVAIGATLKGVEGVKMVSKKNGKSIFIPTIGYYFEKDFYSGSYIWATDICETSNWYAYAIGFSSGYAYITSYYRIAGCNIRPVCK